MKYLEQFLFEGRKARRALFIGKKAYKYGRSKLRYGKKESSYKETKKKKKKKRKN